VELDCHDGNDGQPIVTHAYTLVKPCSFESIIRYMEPNLFKTSPYPVILNIENHCSLEQQKEMARILKDILGGKDEILLRILKKFLFFLFTKIDWLQNHYQKKVQELYHHLKI
jgi:hypothetical protein